MSIGFLTLVLINMSHLMLQIWRGLNHISVMITCILVMVRGFSYLILVILSYIHHIEPSLCLMFFMSHIFKNLCFLFRNFILITIFILNFTHFCFISRISIARHYSFPVRVKMVSMFCPSLLLCQFLKLIGFLVYLLLLIYGIVNWVILLPVFSIFYSKKTRLLVALNASIFSVKLVR